MDPRNRPPAVVPHGLFRPTCTYLGRHARHARRARRAVISNEGTLEPGLGTWVAAPHLYRRLAIRRHLEPTANCSHRFVRRTYATFVSPALFSVFVLRFPFLVIGLSFCIRFRNTACKPLTLSYVLVHFLLCQRMLTPQHRSAQQQQQQSSTTYPTRPSVPVLPTDRNFLRDSIHGRPVSSVYSQPSPEAAVFAAHQLRYGVAHPDPLEVSPPSSPDIASPKEG